MKKGISLATSVACITAGVIAVAMFLYAIYQYIVMPEMTVLGLFVEHSWHVIVLGLLTYVILHILLYREVVRPIQTLYVKLYAIPRGDRRPVAIHSNIYEIQQIAESVNILLSEIKPSSQQAAPASLDGYAAALRMIASKQTDELLDADREALNNVARVLEEASGITEAHT